MSDKQNSSNPKVMILVAAGFDEVDTVQWMYLFRQIGLATEIIGHKSGLIKGAIGLVIQPDRTLVDLDETEGFRLIVLPGTERSVMALLVDPRVHRLFASAGAGSGHVALLSQAEEAIIRAGFVELLAAPNVLGPGRKDVTDFGRYLTDLLAERGMLPGKNKESETDKVKGQIREFTSTASEPKYRLKDSLGYI